MAAWLHCRLDHLECGLPAGPQNKFARARGTGQALPAKRRAGGSQLVFRESHAALRLLAHTAVHGRFCGGCERPCREVTTTPCSRPGRRRPAGVCSSSCEATPRLRSGEARSAEWAVRLRMPFIMSMVAGSGQLLLRPSPAQDAAGAAGWPPARCQAILLTQA